MAWLFKFKNSKVWWLGYRMHGKQFLRSTGHRKKTDAEAELQRVIAMTAASKANALTRELYEQLTGQATPAVSLKHALASWISEASGSTEPNTVKKYRMLEDLLVTFFKADERGPVLGDVRREDLQRFLAVRREGVRSSTANLTRKILAAFFQRCKAQGWIRDNPIDGIPRFKAGRDESLSRRPFTLEELATLYRLAPDPFWRYAVLAGFTTGLRLGDLATMPLGAVDFHSRVIRLRTRKTGRVMCIPIAPPLFDLLSQRADERKGAGPTEPFWPEHAARYESDGSSWFSHRFYDAMLVPAGLAKVRQWRAAGDRKSARREGNDVSFHCLRHSCVSFHAANQQNQQTVKILAGHSSDQVNDLYTKLPGDVLERAVAALPDITRP